MEQQQQDASLTVDKTDEVLDSSKHSNKSSSSSTFLQDDDDPSMQTTWNFKAIKLTQLEKVSEQSQTEQDLSNEDLISENLLLLSDDDRKVAIIDDDGTPDLKADDAEDVSNDSTIGDILNLSSSSSANGGGFVADEDDKSKNDPITTWLPPPTSIPNSMGRDDSDYTVLTSHRKALLEPNIVDLDENHFEKFTPIDYEEDMYRRSNSLSPIVESLLDINPTFRSKTQQPNLDTMPLLVGTKPSTRFKSKSLLANDAASTTTTERDGSNSTWETPKGMAQSTDDVTSVEDNRTVACVNDNAAHVNKQQHQNGSVSSDSAIMAREAERILILTKLQWYLTVVFMISLFFIMVALAVALGIVVRMDQSSPSHSPLITASAPSKSSPTLATAAPNTRTGEKTGSFPTSPTHPPLSLTHPSLQPQASARPTSYRVPIRTASPTYKVVKTRYPTIPPTSGRLTKKPTVKPFNRFPVPISSSSSRQYPDHEIVTTRQPVSPSHSPTPSP